MVALRRTHKLQKALPASTAVTPASDGALGDWYVNRLTVDRRPLLLLVSDRSLLPIVIPARDVAELPLRLSEIVALRLRRLGIAADVIRSEVATMDPVVVGPTLNRSVLGIMVDFAKGIPFYLDTPAWDESTLPFVEARLAETPCYAGKRFEDVVFPDRKAPELLIARWRAG